jgi:acyl-CoA synthetase (AMP-forming)/AMP-acid ligase II
MNLSMLLEMAADGAGDRALVGPKNGGLTAARLQRRARNAAAQFGTGSAKHVVLLDVNSEAVPIALFGAALANMPFVPVNYRLDDARLGEIVSRLVPAAVVAGLDAAQRIRDRDGITTIERETLGRDVGADNASTPPPASDADPEAVAVMLFTSGTTGVAKAALLRHRHLVSYVIGTVEFMGAHEDEAQLVSVPPYHIAGISAILTSIYAGRRIVYLPTFEAGSWVATAASERISHAMLVPTMLGRILDVIETRDTRLPALSHLSYGGGRMPVELIERAMDLLPHVDFVNAYGLTETSSTVAVLGPEQHREAFASSDPAVRARLRSVGVPLPSVEVEIRSSGGAVVPVGERGEVYVRGGQVAGEYLGRSLLTEDGWFPTRDAGYFDEGGFLYLDGRLDDVIVRGGENLSPGEIEDVLLDHEAVAAACVVGVPDMQWGEVVAAVVVLVVDEHASEGELRRWVRARLRSAKAPEFIEFRDELPYNETGKLLRRVLRDELTEVNQARQLTATPRRGQMP